MAVLTTRDQTYPLTRNVTLIGSAPECDIAVSSPHLSRRHALVVRDRKGFLLIDFRSTNGIAVNGAPVDVHRLVNGDAIKLSGATGDQEVRFEFHAVPDHAPPPARTAPPSPTAAAMRVSTLAAATRRVDDLRVVLDELIALTGADRAGIVVQSVAEKPRVTASFARKRTEQGPAEDTVSLMPGPAKRIREGEHLVFLEDGMRDNAHLAANRGPRAAIPILLIRSAVVAGLRLRGSLHGILQIERTLFSEPFSRTAADVVEACRVPLALALAAHAHRAGP